MKELAEQKKHQPQKLEESFRRRCEQDHCSFELHAVSTNKGEQAAMLRAANEIWPWVNYIHIREKHLTLQQRFNWAKQMSASGIPASHIVINGANPLESSRFYQGVHWSQEMLHKAGVEMAAWHQHDVRMRLGISVHSAEEARIAEEFGADYLFFGHVYASQSKPDTAPRGLAVLAEVCSSVRVPVIAIGGIQPSHIQAVRSSGARGAAVISSILKHESPVYAAALFKQAVEAGM